MGQHWDAEGLWRELRPLLGDLGVEVLESVGSTNTALLERARHSAGRRHADDSTCLLVAETQTAGRGRMGRDWHSLPGASLTFSLSLPFAPESWSGLSLAVGVALTQALEPEPGPHTRLQLKWPNDLWLTDGSPGHGRKLGGILIETVALGQRRLCVVGIGLNITPEALPATLTHGQACVQALHPGITAAQALRLVAKPLVLALLRFQKEGFTAFEAGFAERDLLRGCAITTTQPGVPGGVACGVDSTGALLVREAHAPHTVHALSSGEVSVRLEASP
jgi:BirA family transcriptional regulator, biotin operon repressor / biotin---[acetyl-CoA-carboxylase] ligase